jgi:hypothetical protein
MPLAITNCQVIRNGAVVINNPTSAELYNDMQPTMYITVTGGNPNPPLVNNAAYKITGTVNGIDRTFLNMKCVNTGDPARFDKS